MPGIDLSTLNAEELRNLLSAVQRREQSVLAGEVAAELAARRARPANWAAAAVVTEPEPDAAPPRRTLAIVLAAGVVAALGIGLGWKLTRPEEALPAAPVLPVVVASPPPSRSPAPSPTRLEVLPRPETAPSPPPRISSPPKGPVAAARPAPARSGSTQERRLRLAYERALDAGVDQRAIDRGQARWRQKLARTRDPERRRALYARRIGELEAAARWNGGR